MQILKNTTLFLVFSNKATFMKLSIRLLFIWITLAVPDQVNAQTKSAWGDQGNGTYINPVLNATILIRMLFGLEKIIIWFALNFILWACRYCIPRIL